jgi:SAM-dependent methyltransferase
MTSFYSQFAPYYEQVFPFRAEVYNFLNGLAPSQGARILDLGCGPGHYCGRFSLDGYIAEGVDLDSNMIAAATAAYPGPTFRCGDIAGPDAFRGRYHLIYSIGNVLSHLSHASIEILADQIFQALEYSGYWVFQVVNWDYLLTRKEYSFAEKKIEDGQVSFYRTYPKITEREAYFDVRLMSEGKTLFQDRSTLYPMKSDSYDKLHLSRGFEFKGVYAGFDRSEFRKESDSGLVMVFRKP